MDDKCEWYWSVIKRIWETSCGCTSYVSKMNHCRFCGKEIYTDAQEEVNKLRDEWEK